MKSGVYQPPEPRLLFGQFLLEKKKVDSEILKKALAKQEHDAESSTIKESHRFLGQVLLEDFSVFKNRVELNKYLVKFKEFKDKIEADRIELMNVSSKSRGTYGE
jgi:hypothetical protein